MCNEYYILIKFYLNVHPFLEKNNKKIYENNLIKYYNLIFSNSLRSFKP